MFSLPGQTVLMTCHAYPLSKHHPKAQVVQIKQDQGRVELNSALQWLAEQEVNEVQVEAGSVLCGALLQAGLVDEMIIYMAPHLMGDQAKGLFQLPGIRAMEQRITLTIKDIRMVGKDVKLTVAPQDQ